VNGVLYGLPLPSLIPCLPAAQETGYCPYGEECHYTHNISELNNVDCSANFVTKAVDSGDSESIVSTESAKSKDDRSTASR
jgi:hypothetical protein